MTIRGKYIDKNVMASLLYMQSAAMNRGMKRIDLDLFTYSLFITCREYIESYIDHATVNNILSMFSSRLPDTNTSSDPVKLFDLVYDKRVSDIIRSKKVSGGAMSCLFDAMLADKEIHDTLIACGLDLTIVQNGVSEELRRDSAEAKENESAAPPASSLPPKSRPKNPSSKPTPSNVEPTFYTNLTELAKNNQLSEAYGRETETSRVILTLLRKVKGNPLLIGEAGVGKTAIVERLAMMIAKNEVPSRIADCTIYSIDVAALVAGTNLRGMLEEKLNLFMRSVVSRPDVILFIDEIHMLMGTGDHNGSADLGNMLKPYLARGEVRCIGATTIGDFNRHMRRDAALCRRFQRINVDEMTPEQTSGILEKCRESYEDFHGVSITSEAIDKAVLLSGRYIVDRRYPDKAFDCIDDACARASIYDCMVEPSIVEESVSSLSSIPIDIIRSRESDRLSEVKDSLPLEIIGNDAAINKLCSIVSSGLSRTIKRNRPISTIVVHGPKGVGKKSIIRKLSEILYGFNSLLEIDGNDYRKSSSVNSIVGTSPGYIGYEDEGRLYSGVRKKPYCVILFTNFDAMHHAVKSIIIRTIRAGLIDDSRGLPVDFRNTIIVFSQDDKKTSGSMGFSKSEGDYHLERGVWSGILEEIDGEVVFNSVSAPDMKKIAWLEASAFADDISELGLSIDVGEALISETYERCKHASTPSEIRRLMRTDLDKMVSYSTT
jgi:ATP-dependent Clp protease ATP-binding subunit ClpA